MACVVWPFTAVCSLVLILVRCALHLVFPTCSRAMMVLEKFAWTLCIWALTGVACLVTFVSVWVLGSLCCVFLELLWVFVRLRRLFRKFYIKPFLILSKAGTSGKLWSHTLSNAINTAFHTYLGKVCSAEPVRPPKFGPDLASTPFAASYAWLHFCNLSKGLSQSEWFRF